MQKSGLIFIVDKSFYKCIHFIKFIYRITLFSVVINIMIHKPIFQIAYQYQLFYLIHLFLYFFIYVYKNIK